MNYMTAEDKLRLEGQLAALTRNRKVISERIGTARAMGDLKENAEYHAAKEDQALEERKIREIEEKLSTAVVVDGESAPEGMVVIGTTVVLRDVDNGDEDLYRLVGDASGSFDVEYIEVTPQSPMGLSLFKAHVGETIRVDLPRGAKRFEIVEIK